MLKSHAIPAFLFLLIAATSAPANVVVKGDPPDVQYKTFDPTNPPADMPHLNPGEAAVTINSFRISAGADFEPISRKKGDDGWTTVVAVHGLTINLQLHIVVWLPTGVSDKLKAHEEGHRKISEKIYLERALAAAKAAGEAVDGKRFTGQGPNWKDAAGNAVNPVINDSQKEYVHRTAEIADIVNDTYDAITRHGSNDVPEADAIKQAFDRYAQDHPTTQPAGRK